MTAVIAAVAAGCLVARPSTAGAAVGNWAAHAACPADSPAMLASPSGDYTACVTFGEIVRGSQLKLGRLSLDGAVLSQFGVHGPSSDEVSAVPGTTPQTSKMRIAGTDYLLSPIDPSLCSLLPSDPPGARSTLIGLPQQLCLTLSDQVRLDSLLDLRIEPAGAPSDFRLSGFTDGGPAVTLPLKLRLISSALGPNCYIGSNSQPIRLRLRGNGPAGHHEHVVDPNGFAVTSDIYAFGGTLQDTSFAVPAARGCGSLLMDTILNLAFGLPSGGGKNSASVHRFVSIQSTTAGGSELSQSFEAARNDPWWPWD